VFAGRGGQAGRAMTGKDQASRTGYGEKREQRFPLLGKEKQCDYFDLPA
jgi:hypothetical protein